MNRIREVRMVMRMTQSDLADATGISQAGISRMEGEGLSLTAESLMRIAQALGVSSDYLLGLTDDPRPVIEGPAVTLKEWAIIQSMRKGDIALAIQMMMAEAK